MVRKFMDKCDEADTVLDRRMTQLAESRNDFDKLLSRDEFHEGCEEIKRRQRVLLAIATHILDEERAATNARIDRVEADVQELKAR